MSRPQILLISTAFFGYEDDIISAFKRRGADVDYFDERPSNSSAAKAILRVHKPLLGRVVRAHFESIYKAIWKRKYDLVLVVKGEVVPAWFLARLRTEQPQANFAFYSFDAIRNNPNCLELFPYFDRLYSFDFNDVRYYPQLELKHLFYAREYAAGPELASRRYDVSFVGTLHSKRFPFVRSVLKVFTSTYQFFYVPAPWFYYLRRLIGAEFRGVARADISFRKLARTDVAKVFSESRAILDMQREGQSGLTMRTFEVLASGATLITSNPFIKATDLYDPARVIVLPPDGLGDIDTFAEHVSSRLSRDGRAPVGFEKYSIDAWAKSFIDDLQQNALSVAS